MAQPRQARPTPTATPKTEDTEKKSDEEILYDMDVSVGYARYSAIVKTGVWYPVWIFIQAREKDIEGQVTIQQPNNTLMATVPFQVSKGSLKRYLTFYQLNPRSSPSIEVQVRLGRFTEERFNTPLRFAEPGEQHVLVLSETPGGFGALAREPVDTSSDEDAGSRANLPPAQRARLRQAVSAQFGGTKIIYGEPDLLPEDPIALEGIDGMVVTTPRVRTLNARQWEALRAWVAGGGRLLLAGGRNQPFIEQSVLKGAFGIKLGQTQPVPMADLFTGPETTSGSLLVSWPEGEWTRVELGDPRHPLIVGKQAGRGWFHLCAAALDEPVMSLIKTHGDPERLWPALLERHFTQTPLEGLAETAEGAIGFDLQRPFGFNLVGAWWVFTFLGSYILVALPLTWVVCGRLRRREWAWPAAIALALGFAWYGYASGLRSQSSVFQANEVTVVTHATGASSARAVTLSSIFSPRRYRTDLVAPTGTYPNRLSNQMPGNNFNPYGEDDLYSGAALPLSFQPPVMRLAGFYFHPWSARGLRCDFTVPAGGGITGNASIRMMTPGSLPGDGKVTNNTPWDFARWWISNGMRVWSGEGPLRRGATASLANVMSGQRASTMPEMLVQTINTNILEPALRELSGAGRRQDAGMNNPYWSEVQRQPERPRSELFFIGQAEGAISPLTQQMRLERRRGVLIYETELTQGGINRTTDAALFPSRWTWVAKPEQVNNIAWINDKNDDGVETPCPLFPPQTLDIELVPEGPVDTNRKGALRFEFKLVNYPDENTLFVSKADAEKYQVHNPGDPYGMIDPATGMPVNLSPIDPVTGLPVDPSQVTPNAQSNPGAAATPEPKKEKEKPYPEYQLMGCHVKVFNYRRQLWESTQIVWDGNHAVSPLKDYLRPGSCALLLRLDAAEEKLLFRPKNNPAGKIVTGADLLREPNPGTPQGPRNPDPTPAMIYHLKLKGTKVKLESP